MQPPPLTVAVPTEVTRLRGTQRDSPAKEAQDRQALAGCVVLEIACPPQPTLPERSLGAAGV